MEISIAAETVTHILGIPITNSLLASLLTTVVLVTISYFATKNLKEVPRGIQSFIEYAVESLYNMIQDVTDDKEKTYKFFPFVATIFLFIITSNWMGLLPGYGTLGIYEETAEGEQILVSFFRSANSDLNSTIALAVVGVLSIQLMGIAVLGFAKYSKKFLNFSSPIAFFIGLLEIISEIAKMISFSFRLFGNIFAGEVLLTVIMTLAPFVAPLPFFGLELFVGFIQALVFAMLLLVFMNIATMEHEE
ncbi:MAG: F0F1 ATP synthase subunit A [Candidatus Pacebacteria bacterium]|jgi:F-type H+-transporting ATPase subunit a|nr:F0F1 ATP synthase subunit A [Candidatus Paceibacterota bacterium]